MYLIALYMYLIALYMYLIALYMYLIALYMYLIALYMYLIALYMYLIALYMYLIALYVSHCIVHVSHCIVNCLYSCLYFVFVPWETQQGGYVRGATNLYYYYYYYIPRSDAKGKRLLKKATLRGIGDIRGKRPFRLNELSLNFRRKLLIFIAQISSLV